MLSKADQSKNSNPRNADTEETKPGRGKEKRKGIDGVIMMWTNCRICGKEIDVYSDRFGIWYKAEYDDFDEHGNLCMECSKKLLPIIKDKMCEIVEAEQRIKAKVKKEKK